MTRELLGIRYFSRSAASPLVLFGAFGFLLLVAEHDDYPMLHTALDTGMFLVSSVLALLLWDMGARLNRPFKNWLAISFALTAVLEALHILVAVEWSGVMVPIAQAAHALRPATWPPAAHLLPLGIAGSVWLLHHGKRSTLGFASILIVAGAGLLAAYYRLPPYSPPALLGITRPTLIAAPLLWAIAGIACWRQRAMDRVLPILAIMSATLFLACVPMLFSQAPNDSQAMVSHLGRLCGYLVLLFAIVQMASQDMVDRIKAERELAQLNQALEDRVLERTSMLESANAALKEEAFVRRQAETKAQAQLERLDLLHQITRAIGERQDLQSIFQVVVRSVEEHLPIDFGCICLHDQGTNWLDVARVGIRSESLAMELAMTQHSRVVIDENGLSRCMRGQLVYEPDIQQVPMPFPQRLAQGGLRAVVMSPLLIESQVFGVFIAARREPESFSSGECEFLRQLSEHVALAAHQAQLHGALQQAYDDLRQTQQAVMQQERLRALGQMASGIAHDINNAISPVALYTESLLEREPGLSPRARGYLETIQRAIDDVAKTVARMREFYRSREPQLALAPVRINALAQQVIDLTRARWSDMPQQRGSVIAMTTEFGSDLPAIMGAENEIREALINLIFNAVDAMPDGGTLTLRTEIAQEPSKSNGAPASRHIVVEIGDTGIGMSEDTRRRCMEPFYTTKGERGTGLGLAMVYGVIQRHSAEIEIESAIGTGTTVRLSFPVYDNTANAEAGAPVYETPVSRQRILVVDDDPLLLKSLRDTLEADGHIVAAANGGQAGIDAFQASMACQEPYDVVITDLGMPHIDGRKVIGGVKTVSPSTPVILLTGWGQRLMEDGDTPPNVSRVLSKPPKLRELREALAYCHKQKRPDTPT